MKTVQQLIYRSTLLLATAAITAGLLGGCQANNTMKGGAIGAGAGGAIGGVIGHQSGNTAIGAIIGATVGGAAGALIGRQMDKQAAEIKRDLEGAQVERVGEGIKITFNSGLLFALNSSQLNSTTQQNLRELAATLNKYEDTEILIEGHTDNTGGDDLNQKLSEQRAQAVASYLTAQAVKNARLSTVGYGESQPVADNANDAGRDQNRRVEVAIFANKKMKKLAEKNQLGNS